MPVRVVILCVWVLGSVFLWLPLQLVASLADSPGVARLPWQIGEAVTTADEFGGERGFTAEDEEAGPVVEVKSEVAEEEE